MSQSQLSSSVRALEQELGADIFIRSNKGVTLTPFGEEFLPYISSILLQIQQIKQLGQNVPHNARLSIANSGFRFISEIIARTDAYYITATPMRAYQKTPYYPNTRILSLAVTEYSAQLGWIKSKSTILSDIGHDFIQLLNEYF